MTPEERASALFTTGIDREMRSNGYSACAWVALGSKLMCYCDANEEAVAAKVRELAAPFAAAIRDAVAAETKRCARLCDGIAEKHRAEIVDAGSDGEGHRFNDAIHDTASGADECADAIRRSAP